MLQGSHVLVRVGQNAPRLCLECGGVFDSTRAPLDRCPSCSVLLIDPSSSLGERQRAILDAALRRRLRRVETATMLLGIVAGGGAGLALGSAVGVLVLACLGALGGKLSLEPVVRLGYGSAHPLVPLAREATRGLLRRTAIVALVLLAAAGGLWLFVSSRPPASDGLEVVGAATIDERWASRLLDAIHRRRGELASCFDGRDVTHANSIYAEILVSSRGRAQAGRRTGPCVVEAMQAVFDAAGAPPAGTALRLSFGAIRPLFGRVSVISTPDHVILKPRSR